MGEKFAADAEGTITTPDAVPEGWRILDVGPQTIRAFGEALVDAKTVIWNGTLGVFGVPRLCAGHKSAIRPLVELTSLGVTTIVGGGDSAAAVERTARLTSSPRLDGRRRLARVHGGTRVARRRCAARPWGRLTIQRAE